MLNASKWLQLWKLLPHTLALLSTEIKAGLLRWGRGHCFQIIEIENLSAKLLLKSTAQAATFSSVALKAV
jgi:hypothetical protein